MKSFILLFVYCIVFITIAGGIAKAEVLNPGFEFADDPCDGEDFSRPVDWQSWNFAAVIDSFQPSPQHGQSTLLDWFDPNAIITKYSGNSSLVLSTDDIGKDDSAEWWAAVAQQIEIIEGQMIEFYYFFGTFDYSPYPDEGNLILLQSGTFTSEGPSPDYDRDNAKIVDICSVDDVGDYRSTDGWVKYQYVFTAEDANLYDMIGFRVEDKKDQIFKSYLAIDDVRIGLVPDTGDFDDDWKVDFVDYSKLISHWGQSYSDPNMYEGTDLDDSNSVDINDLVIFCDYWLDGV